MLELALANGLDKQTVVAYSKQLRSSRTDRIRTSIRLLPSLHTKLRKEAAAFKVSLNTLILFVIEEALAAHDRQQASQGRNASRVS